MPMERSEQRSSKRESTVIYTPLFFIDNNKMFNFLYAEGFRCEHISVRFSDEFGTGIKTYYEPPVPIVRHFFDSKFFDIVEVGFTKLTTWEKIVILQDKILFKEVTPDIVKTFKKDLIFVRKI